MRIILLITAFICGSLCNMNGQSNKVVQILNIENHIPVPFTIIENHKSSLIQSNIDGFIELESVPESSISLYHPYYHSLDTNINSSGNDTIHIYLSPKELGDLKATDPSARKIINYTLGFREENNIYNNKNFKYTSYNKVRVSTNDIEEAKGMLSKLLKLFSINLKEYHDHHHILLSESVTKREYVDKFNDKEYILASKVSGIDNPRVLSLNSQMQSMNLYDRFIRVIDKSYVSPLYIKSDTRYHYKLLKKIPRKYDDLYVVQFNPNGKLKQVLLTGVLFISSKKWAIESAVLRPDKSSSVDFDIYFNYKLQEEKWVPNSYTTRIGLDNISAKKFQFVTRYSTYISDFEFNAHVKKSWTDDISIEYSNEIDTSKSYEVIKENRKEYFTEIDQNTYSYYDTVGSLSNIDFALDFAEHLYNKEIKTKYFNFDMNRAIDFNNYEGVRIGVGANTKLDLKEDVTVGGHMAYGLLDNESKYGLYARYKVLPLKKLTLFGGFDHETFEVAHSRYSFYRYQYSTEWLRRFSINLMDIADQYYIGLETSPIKYTSLSFKVLSSKNTTPYRYRYKDNTTQEYQYTDLELGVRFAFGETNFKLFNNKYPLRTHYPIIWTKFNFGLDNFLGGDYKYFKFESRLEYTIRSFLLGRAMVQLNVGHAVGELPYYQLFEGYGAEGAAVAHNRFETMAINEFLSSTYFNIFLTYEIVKLYFRDYPWFRPSIELDYNFGVGALSNKEDHQLITYKTMEKTYHETGVSIRNLLTFKLVAVKAGLGIGNYFRFGPYAHSTFKENYNVKFVLTFAL